MIDNGICVIIAFYTQNDSYNNVLKFGKVLWKILYERWVKVSRKILHKCWVKVSRKILYKRWVKVSRKIL